MLEHSKDGKTKVEDHVKELRAVPRVEDHVEELRAVSRHMFKDDVVGALAGHEGRSTEKLDRLAASKFRPDWRKVPGHRVPARFTIPPPDREDRPKRGEAGQAKDEKAGKAKDAQGAGSALTPKGAAPKRPPRDTYSDYAGLRFPTLETAANFDYHQDKGLKRIKERSFPIKVPGHRRIDPYLREYIHFLHNLDPARFTTERIAERYRLRAKTVKRVIQEWATNRFLLNSGLVNKLQDKQTTREAVVLKAKETQYAKWVGFDQMGDEDDQESDDELVGEFKGWRSTSDWVRRQTVEVEMMSAFPMMEKRDPMPKRVDVDLVVKNTAKHKIINWVDPHDKVVF